VIRKVTLGPRSRVLEAKEAEQRELGDRVLGGLLPQESLDAVLHPPTPGPANPTSLRGCACGRVHIPHSDDPNEAIEMDGIVHRYSRPCYGHGPEGERVYYDMVKQASVTERLNAIERVLADIVKRMG
jgi:hypothetical protein